MVLSHCFNAEFLQWPHELESKCINLIMTFLVEIGIVFAGGSRHIFGRLSYSYHATQSASLQPCPMIPHLRICSFWLPFLNSEIILVFFVMPDLQVLSGRKTILFLHPCHVNSISSIYIQWPTLSINAHSHCQSRSTIWPLLSTLPKLGAAYPQTNSQTKVTVQLSMPIPWQCPSTTKMACQAHYPFVSYSHECDIAKRYAQEKTWISSCFSHLRIVRPSPPPA